MKEKALIFLASAKVACIQATKRCAAALSRSWRIGKQAAKAGAAALSRWSLYAARIVKRAAKAGAAALSRWGLNAGRIGKRAVKYGVAAAVRFRSYIALAACLSIVAGAALFAQSRLPFAPAPNAPTPVHAATPEPKAEAAAAEVRESLIRWPVAGREVITPLSEAPLWSESLGEWSVHPGVDLRAAQGEAVYAAHAGLITRAEKDLLWGYVVELEGEGGLMTRYGSLISLNGLKVGDAVRAGDILGAAGSSALSEADLGSHLHFEAYLLGAALHLPSPINATP